MIKKKFHRQRDHNHILIPKPHTSGWLAVCLLLPVSAAAAGKVAGSASPVDTGATVTWLAVYVMAALGFSFLCSVTEAVLLSITPAYIEGQKAVRPRLAARLKRLKQDRIDQSLSAILTLNTIAHTIGAIGAGAQATILFGSAWFGLFSALMTLAILFLSEIVPKTIGAVYWPRLVGPTALFVSLLIVMLYPIVWLSERVTRMISKSADLVTVNRDELIAMARAGGETGQIRGNESKMIQNLLRFDLIHVTDIMTPRSVITALPEEMTVSDSLERITGAPFSRLPVYRSGLDDIAGFVLKDDILLHTAQDRGEEPLAALKREIPAVPESMSLAALMERLLKDRQHIAIVVNEYGGTDGLVTLEDLIETLMGLEIVDETDKVVDMRALARKRWLERARAMGIDHNF